MKASAIRSNISVHLPFRPPALRDLRGALTARLAVTSTDAFYASESLLASVKKATGLAARSLSGVKLEWDTAVAADGKAKARPAQAVNIDGDQDVVQFIKVSGSAAVWYGEKPFTVRGLAYSRPDWQTTGEVDFLFAETERVLARSALTAAPAPAVATARSSAELSPSPMVLWGWPTVMLAPRITGNPLAGAAALRSHAPLVNGLTRGMGTLTRGLTQGMSGMLLASTGALGPEMAMRAWLGQDIRL